MIDFQKAHKDKIVIKTAGIQFKNLQGICIVFTKTKYFAEKPAKKMCVQMFVQVIRNFKITDNFKYRYFQMKKFYVITVQSLISKVPEPNKAILRFQITIKVLYQF